MSRLTRSLTLSESITSELCLCGFCGRVALVASRLLYLEGDFWKMPPPIVNGAFLAWLACGQYATAALAFAIGVHLGRKRKHGRSKNEEVDSSLVGESKK